MVTSDYMKKMGPVTSKDMQTPPSLRSGHLDIKDNVLKKMMGVKFHITFGRHGRPKGAFWASKNSFFFKSGYIYRVGRPDAHFLHK